MDGRDKDFPGPGRCVRGPDGRGQTLQKGQNPFRGHAHPGDDGEGGNIDPDLFTLFQREGIPMDYARRELTLHQIDSTGV
jgi:hypothetical protein